MNGRRQRPAAAMGTHRVIASGRRVLSELLLRASKPSTQLDGAKWMKRATAQPDLRLDGFPSAPRMVNPDRADADVELSVSPDTRYALLERCRREVAAVLSPQLRRRFTRGQGSRGPDTVRVLQWNLLSQALAERMDRFVCCPEGALEWRTRRWRILEDILEYEPDILCLQEVDHYNFLRCTLGRVGFAGCFFPKPDSPCYYLKGNNGPDGCALFYDESRYQLVECRQKVLQVFSRQSNQVTLLCILRRKLDDAELCVVTTHLKGKDLMDFVRTHRGRRPTVIAGDFNAEPWEPVYKTLLSHRDLVLESSYALDEESRRSEEPAYTTWKIREEGEVKHTIDYIFYTPEALTIERRLELPTEGDIGPGRVPSLAYPSDHFSLVADLNLPFSKQAAELLRAVS